MNLVERNYDVVSLAEDLEPLYTIKQFPVFMGVVDQPAEEDVRADVNFHISKSTGMIQITPLLPLDVVYQKDHAPGLVGKEWEKHHRHFAEFVSSFLPRKVFEIGGAHGLLSKYCKQIRPVDWTILEPNPVNTDGIDATFIRGFYTKDTVLPEDIDMLVHSHTLEHVYDPSSFFSALSNMRIGTMMCFSIPNLRKQLEKRYTNVLNFEHTYFCTDEFVEWWLFQNNFEIIQKRGYLEDHSYFYACIRRDGHPLKSAPPNKYNANKKIFIDYISYHKRAVMALNDKIKVAQGPVYLFGAHIFSQFLLSFGLHSDKIVCILDNSEAKQGHRLYGTDLQIASPKILKDVENPVIVLKAGVYNDEIKCDILDNINPNAVFLE